MANRFRFPGFDEVCAEFESRGLSSERRAIAWAWHKVGDWAGKHNVTDRERILEEIIDSVFPERPRTTVSAVRPHYVMTGGHGCRVARH